MNFCNLAYGNNYFDNDIVITFFTDVPGKTDLKLQTLKFSHVVLILSTTHST